MIFKFYFNVFQNRSIERHFGSCVQLQLFDLPHHCILNEHCRELQASNCNSHCRNTLCTWFGRISKAKNTRYKSSHYPVSLGVQSISSVERLATREHAWKHSSHWSACAARSRGTIRRGLHIVVYIYTARHKSSFNSHSADVRAKYGRAARCDASGSAASRVTPRSTSSRTKRGLH